MKILITCFDPFGGESVNPASLVVNKLPDTIAGAEIIKLEIPTVFHKSLAKARAKIDEIKPDFVLSIGQAGNRSRISVERVGINVDDARIPDNEKQSPVDKPIVEGAPAAYFATIPIKDMVRAMLLAKIPAEISNTAGTYVCNHIMYGVLQYIAEKKLNTKAGFIHIPYVPEQVVDKPGVASMPVDALKEGIEIAIKAMIDPASVKGIAEIATQIS